MEGIEKLKRIIELEEKKGYQDKAVLGGLDRFLKNWLSLYGGSVKDPRLLRLLSSGYSSLDIPMRVAWIREVKEKLENTDEKPRRVSSSITSIRGINKKILQKLSRLGIKDIKDLLYFFPRRHIDYTRIRKIGEIEVGVEQTIIGFVWEARERQVGKGMKIAEAIIGDETGNIKAVWFNQPYLAKILKTNSKVVLSGKVDVFRGRKVMESPEYELLEGEELLHTGRLVPVYPLTEGITQRMMRRFVKEALDIGIYTVEEFLPGRVIEEENLLPLREAIRQAHFPDSMEMKERARRRLAFDELFIIQLGVLSKKEEWKRGEGISFKEDPSSLDRLIGSLPFELTGAQRRVLGEIIGDMRKNEPMSRLLQGEVGSGKTIVALLAMVYTWMNGYQSALMAPTEILAEQHFDTFSNILKCESLGGYIMTSKIFDKPINIGLLIGGMGERQKRMVQNLIKAVSYTHLTLPTKA